MKTKAEDYLTIKQATEITGKSRTTLHYHRRRGAFPGAIKVSAGDHVTAWLLPRKEVEDWTPEGPGRKYKPQED